MHFFLGLQKCGLYFFIFHCKETWQYKLQQEQKDWEYDQFVQGNHICNFQIFKCEDVKIQAKVIVLDEGQSTTPEFLLKLMKTK